ncbi:MAG: histidine phosphatase family protein [Polyangiales bacterium]
MSQLVMVRHGQAAAFSEDSDRLTPLGEKQAATLGEFWVKQGVVFDEVIVGALRRHVQTEAQVAAAYKKAGLPWPEAKSDARWNEYDAPAIMQLGAAVRERDPEFAKLVEAFEKAHGGPEHNRYFQRMFEVLMQRWVSEDVRADSVETFEAFHSRVSAAFNAVLEAPGSNRRVVVFSSGGPISVTVQQSLQAPKPMAIEVNWRVRNTSLTEYVFGRGRLSLDLFNAAPHLLGTSLETFR